jgi:hypothetical protein
VRHVGEQSAHGDEHLDPERLGELEDLARERAPAHVRLVPPQQDQVVWTARHPHRLELDRRPLDAAPVAVLELDHGPCNLEVVELLWVDVGERLGSEGVGHEAERGAGRHAGVVPTLERGHEERPVQGGTLDERRVLHASTMPRIDPGRQ